MKQFNLNQTTGYNVSDRYVPINTQDILSQFENAGYTVQSVQAASVRNSDKNGFQKHLIRMSHPDTQFKIDGLRPELVLKNSFDGTTAFSLTIGVYRLICSNGLEIGNTFVKERIRHVGNDVLLKVLEAAERIKTRFPVMQSQIETMRSYDLSETQQRDLANLVAFRLLGPTIKLYEFSITDLLKVRRPGDVHNDAFTVLNRIQENLTSGHYRYGKNIFNKETNQIELAIRKARRTKSIDKQSQINTLVWDATLDLVA